MPRFTKFLCVVFIAIAGGLVDPLPSWANQNIDSCTAVFGYRPPEPREFGNYRELNPLYMAPESQLYRNVRNLLDKPVTPEWRKYIDAQVGEVNYNLRHTLSWRQLRQIARGELVSERPLSAKQRDELADFFERFQDARSKSSHTVQGVMGENLSGPALRQWHQADELVWQWVESGEPLTLEKIKTLNRYLISREEVRAREGQAPLGGRIMWNSISLRPGEFRTHSMTAGGDSKRTYIAPTDISIAMDDFMNWYTTHEKQLHPIELAAQAYRRLISIHPFFEASGRTSRMVMDWILQRNGYPPALFIERSEVAVFGRYEETDVIVPWTNISNHSTGRAVSLHAESVVRASRAMKVSAAVAP